MSWNFTGDRPVYLQIMEVIQLRIVTEYYHPGEKLPSVRELAEEAQVNPNTMQKALSELEREELLFSQRTTGRFVTCDEQKIMGVRNNMAQSVIDEFLEKMRSLGYKKDDILKMLEKN